MLHDPAAGPNRGRSSNRRREAERLLVKVERRTKCTILLDGRFGCPIPFSHSGEKIHNRRTRRIESKHEIRMPQERSHDDGLFLGLIFGAREFRELMSLADYPLSSVSL